MKSRPSASNACGFTNLLFIFVQRAFGGILWFLSWMPPGAVSNRGNWLGASGDSGIEISSGNTKSSLLSLSSLKLSVE